MNYNIEINFENDKWNNTSFDIYSEIEESLIEVIKKINFKPDADVINLSVLLSDDKYIKELNREYRSKDKSTNVLSFPSNDGDGFDTEPNNEISIGDIIFSYENIEHESIEQNKIFKEHFYHLSVHSILHLFGYDHIDEKEAEIMEKLEIEILSYKNIANPYKYSIL